MSQPAVVDEAAPAGAAFSPVDNEAPLRWWRRLRLVPRDGLGVGRRAVLLALLAWLPIALWAWWAGRFVDTGEPLIQYYGVHVRCLIAIPLLVLAEAALHKAGGSIARRFVATGAVGGDLRPRFDAVLRDVVRLRDASLPWVLTVGVAVAWAIVDPPQKGDVVLAWALAPDGSLRFGGWWFVYIVRPIFVALLLGWLWRIALLTRWMWRIGKLPLALVPTHPDRLGGIAFVETLPKAFTLVTLALAAMLASRWAHEVLHDGAALRSFVPTLAAFAAGWAFVVMLPLLALSPALRAARKAALPAYSVVVGAQGRALHRRWIEREASADETMLEPEGLGPLADAAVAYEATSRMRKLAVTRKAVTGILLPMAIPFVLLAATRVPLKDLALGLIKVFV